MMSKKISFTSIGDCCVDVYPDHNKIFLGGTAFNTAFHAVKANVNASIISAVGNDSYGKKFISEAKTYGIDTSHILQKKGTTSSVQIPLDREGKPIFAGWDLGVLQDFCLQKEDRGFLKEQDIIKITYLKPLQKLFDSLCEMLRSAENDTRKPLTICDFAGGSQYSIDFLDIKTYVSLFDICIRSVDHNDQRELEFLRNLSRKYRTVIIASLGSHGSIVFHNNDAYAYPAITTQVTDTTGAGDAYITVFAIVYFQTHNIHKAMKEATKAAAQTITHFGANAS